MISRLTLSLFLFAGLAAPLAAQHHRDPLNPPEIDQLRDAAQDPDIRLKLYITFARARLDALQQAFSDPKITDRGQQTHDRLQDFLDVYDEFDDNVETFADRKADLRKVMKLVIEADNEFQSKLRAIRDSATVTPEIIRQYDFLLTNALDAVDSGAKDHRQLLAEQEETFKHKKKTQAENRGRTE
jgi:hypothetical protein